MLIRVGWPWLVCHFDVASGPFKCHFGILMWPVGYFVEIPLENKSERGKELVKHTECSDVLVQCKLLAAVSE